MLAGAPYAAMCERMPRCASRPRRTTRCAPRWGWRWSDGPAKAEHIAQRHAIPLKFLEKILFDLRHAGLVATRRGPEGGYWLARDPAEITVADVLRAVDGPLADVHGLAPEDVEYEEGFAALQKVWVAVRTSLRSVLESVTIADLAGGTLPPAIEELTAGPDSWARR